MANEEKSRDAFQPTKRYAAVGMQQGRVLLDDDFNENERIRLEEERRVNLDVIGPVGSPDEGFLPKAGTIAHGGVDFTISKGTLYLGGLRLWNPADTQFQLQDDWLQQTSADRAGPVPDRTDLVYVEAWQQPVTAIEDGELFEVALGGPDTSTRLRTMWRVQLAQAKGPDCPSAWKTQVASWAAQGLGTVDETGERVTDAMMSVDYFQGQAGDLCTPAITGGYLGAENQTIRVQLVSKTTFVWGFDNGAPVYRATIGGPNNDLVTLSTDPRDQAHWPMPGQVVEILPFGARLPNKEKLADELGVLARVTGAFDPVAHTFTISPAVLPAFGNAWTTRDDAADLGALGYYVRIWDRGDDVTSPLELPIAADTHLGNTGVQVTITGSALVPGDHWIISARPKTPQTFVPWDLEDGRPPHGTRRFFAPLALIQWHADGSFDLLHDCRPYFQPLTRLRGCCTYTVGDGDTSFGRFRKIQDAIDALPDDGGKVCVLPGHYRETVTLVRKHGVTIEGCGPRTVIEPAEGGPWVFAAIGGHDLAIRDLEIDAGTAFGVVLFGDVKQSPKSLDDVAWFTEGRVRRVTLEGLTVRTQGKSAIAAFGAEDLTIRACELVAGPLDDVITPESDLGRWPSILSFADDVLIEDNRVLAVNESVQIFAEAINAQGLVTYTRTALGGIQIGGGSERIEIRENLIDGGNGDGITLGSWAWVPAKYAEPDVSWSDVGAWWKWVAGITIHVNDEGCIEVDWDPPPPDDDDGNPMVPVSMGAVDDVVIRENRILDMGKSGVGVARFFDLSKRDDFITVKRLLIEDNRIEGCLRLPIPELPATMEDVAGQGAITLADVEDLVVRDNDVVRNGKRHIDPICGVFALISTGLVVEHNRIADNAPHVASKDRARIGWRGGVVVTRALPPSVEVEIPLLDDTAVRRQNGEPAARIADNVIVVPEGRAVIVLGAGPISIADNHLTVRGVGLADLAPVLATGAAGLADELKAAPVMGILDVMGGVAVTVVDLAMSNELFWLQLLFYENLAKQDLQPKPGLDDRPPVAASGQILFEGNQVGVDLLAPPNSVVLSAVNLFTLDDVACADNQIEVDRLIDIVLMTTLAIGLSARVVGNRVKESMVPAGFFLIGYSIFSVGVLMNITAHNQTTRCIVASGAQKVSTPNQVLIQLFNKSACGKQELAGDSFEKSKMPLYKE
ncbi:MAG TPA: DUF6519 domain-containing protein [Kofleriaceae bacterium]|nr:DUF6519 domain-containing protein [Kofleriaceae bacterium]